MEMNRCPQEDGPIKALLKKLDARHPINLLLMAIAIVVGILIANQANYSTHIPAEMLEDAGKSK